ncbi:MAG: transporter substrate-binding domain-containing protein [Desulfobacterium sp.]|nr:transporter substrate-binding domain-containing protein [Desulfobacterium sp.]
MDPSLGKCAEKTTLRDIKVVTPLWHDQTNPDGSGLFFDIVRTVYAPVGITMTYDFVPWKRAKKMVGANLADAMLCIWKEDAGRERLLLPRYPLFVEFPAVVFKADAIPDWQGIASLNEKRVLWLLGYDYHLSRQFKDIRFKVWHEVRTRDRALLLLESGRYDACIDALIDMKKELAINGSDPAPFRLEVLQGEKSYVGFARTLKSQRLMAIYDHRIQELLRSGVLKRIFEKWNATFEPDAWQAWRQASDGEIKRIKGP